jgi:hypothetical protein
MGAHKGQYLGNRRWDGCRRERNFDEGATAAFGFLASQIILDRVPLATCYALDIDHEMGLSP